MEEDDEEEEDRGEVTEWRLLVHSNLSKAEESMGERRIHAHTRQCLPGEPCREALSKGHV